MPEIELDQQDSSWSRLMLRVQNGDKEALHQLFTEISPVVRSYLLRRASYWGIPEEALQNTLLTIYNKRDVYLPRRSFKAWMFTIARSKLIDEIRKKAPDFKSLGGGKLKIEKVTSKAPQTYSSIEGKEQDSMLNNFADDGQSEELLNLRRAIEELSEEHREVITLMKIEGYSVKEAALKLGISESALKVRSHRAFKKLCSLVKDEYA